MSYPQWNDNEVDLLRRIAENSSSFASGSVSSIVAGSGITITPAGGTGAVTISSGAASSGVFTGLNGQTITGNASGAWEVLANGTNQNITLTPVGTAAGSLVGSFSRNFTSSTNAQGLELISDGTSIATSYTASTYNAGNNSYGRTAFNRARGTLAAPAEVVNGDILGAVISRAYTNGAFASLAEIDFVVSGAVTANQRPPSSIEFYTNASNGAQTLALTVNAAQQSIHASGTAALPSISFISDPDTGFYRNTANQVTIAAGGAQGFSFTTTRMTNVNGDAYVEMTGVSAVNIIAGGTNQNITLTPSGTGKVLIPDGSAANPGLAFTNDTNSGLYRAGGDQIGLAVNGALSVLFNPTAGSISAVSNLLLAGGGAGTDSVRVTNTTAATSSITGAFRVGNDTAVTTVGIGGGNLWAGKVITAGTGTPASDRQVTLDGTVGTATIKGGNGGWVTSYGFTGAANTALGGFSLYGSDDAANYFFIGPTYLSNYIRFTAASTSVQATTAATSTTSGALQVGSNIGLSGNAGGLSYFGGDIVITTASNNNIFLNATGTNVNRFVAFTKSGLNRINVGTTGNEAGTNTGSNFIVVGYDDAGSLLGTWLQITRAAGNTSLASTTEATTGGAGSFTTPGGIYAAKKIVSATDITAVGALAIGNTVGAAIAVASTHKVTILIGGVTYYLLATNIA